MRLVTSTPTVKMIIGNLYHIKATNGLFYYGLDYLAENRTRVRKILVQSGPLLEKVREILPECKIEVCGYVGIIWEALKGAFLGDVLFTPTPHPLPFLSKQWVVFHDSYPFVKGSKAAIKRLLFIWSLRLSRCTVAYINKSEALPFLVSLGISDKRCIFAPNKFPTRPPTQLPTCRTDQSFISIGLLGTDSKKKNYDELFTSLNIVDIDNCFRVRIYGHNTDYFRDLQLRHPNIRLVLVESDRTSFSEFLSQVHVVASVSKGEGFGRPIAAALLHGVPCFLVDTPVFREFFEPGAFFFGSCAEMARALASLSSNGASLSSTVYSPPAGIQQAYIMAAQRLSA